MTEIQRNEAAMAEILASMRRIVAENDRRRPGSFQTSDEDGEVLVLTRAMRVDLPAEEATRPEPPRPAADPVAKSDPSPEFDRAPDDAAADDATSDEEALLAGRADRALDEAAIADIVRAVLRDEFAGAFGRSLTGQIKTLIQAEVTRAMAVRRD